MNETTTNDEVAAEAPPYPEHIQVSSDSTEGVTPEEIVDALKAVYDPEIGINIVDLGLVYEVDLNGGTVHVDYALTTMGCPIGPLIEQQMQQVLSNVPGVTAVEAEMVLRPAWSPEMMSEEAKAALGYF